MWLIDFIKGLLCKPLVDNKSPVPENKTITMDRESFIERLKGYGVIPMTIATAPQDTTVRLATKKELDRIAPYLTYPNEWYLKDLWDCEDYALQAQCDAGRLFEVTVRLGEGMATNASVSGGSGYHGFCVTLDANFDIWLLEPNRGYPYAGKWFKPCEHGYQIGKVFV